MRKSDVHKILGLMLALASFPSAFAQQVLAENVPQAELIHADKIDIEFTKTFAGAIGWDSVFNVSREHHAAIYRKLADALEPGRRLLLSVGGSGAESLDSSGGGNTSEMFRQNFFYDAYAPDLPRQLIEAAGFEIDLWEVDDPSSRGHIAVIARKI